MKSLFFILCAAMISSHALADDIAKPNCKAPIIPSPLASELVLKQFEKKKDIYQKCISKFVDEQQQISKTSTDVALANVAHDAAELAIKEFNDFTAALNQRNARANSINGDDGDDDGEKN